MTATNEKENLVSNWLFELSELFDKEQLSKEDIQKIDYLILDIDNHIYKLESDNLHLIKVITRFKRMRLTLSED